MTMIGAGFLSGERFNANQVSGFVLAVAGLVWLVLPGLAAPPAASAALMIAAGVAWGIYSLRGRGAVDPLAVTAGNFLRTLPMTAVFSAIMSMTFHLDMPGAIFSIASGAVTSGIGYAIWYSVLPSLNATQAATVQLSVPVIAATGAILVLGEALSLRLIVASCAILLGIGLITLNKRKSEKSSTGKIYK